jgi:hypothetical protein
MSEVSRRECCDGNISTGDAKLESSSSDLADRARQTLEQRGQLRGSIESLSFVLHGEVLVVRGSVPSFYLKQMLQTALKGLDGVCQIDNQVEVVLPGGLRSSSS